MDLLGKCRLGSSCGAPGGRSVFLDQPCGLRLEGTALPHPTSTLCHTCIPDSFCPQLTPTSYPIYGLVASQLGDVDTPTLLPDGVSEEGLVWLWLVVSLRVAGWAGVAAGWRMLHRQCIAPLLTPEA